MTKKIKELFIWEWNWKIFYIQIIKHGKKIKFQFEINNWG